MLSRTSKAAIIIAALGGGTLVAQADVGNSLDVPGVTDNAQDLFGPNTSTYTPIGDETKAPPVLSDVDVGGSSGSVMPTMVMAAPPPPPRDVPEPASLGVLALGAAGLLLKRKR